jgi:hypothetical protein
MGNEQSSNAAILRPRTSAFDLEEQAGVKASQVFPLMGI